MVLVVTTRLVGYQLGIISVLPGLVLLLAGQGLKRLVPGVIKPGDQSDLPVGRVLVEGLEVNKIDTGLDGVFTVIGLETPGLYGCAALSNVEGVVFELIDGFAVVVDHVQGGVGCLGQPFFTFAFALALEAVLNRPSVVVFVFGHNIFSGFGVEVGIISVLPGQLNTGWQIERIGYASTRT
jgi:hypothetical protein